MIERKKKRIVPVTGSGESSDLEGVSKPKRDFREVCASRLKEGTTSEKVKSHLQGKGIEVKEVFIIPSKFKGTISAKVRVALEHKERALLANTWPPHVRILSWINKSKTARRENFVQRQQTEG